MAVLSEEWWGVWWPWMLVWLLTAGGVLTLVVLAVSWFTGVGRSAGQNLTYSICFYLHEKSVMDHYQMRGYAAALRREVEQRTSDSKDGTIRTKVFGVGADAGRRENREVVSRYLEVAEPISVIGLVMDVLEEKDVIVHVDLVNQTVLRNKALTKALTAAPEVRPARPGPANRDIRLRDIEDFVLIRGRFRKIGDTPEGTVFLAPYGDPEDPARGPRVRVTCATEGLRNEVPRGPFSARCLGKVQDWNAEEAVLEVQAMAIFR
ncbi:hypothetical protein [Streptomyces sp. NBC_01207]|uniref:hypothetical protein n=1 Tax=Streptomyces sp. NBC_01207 TaxID=2903772 RepID=UPI002E0F965C|nr:hypothetical protein OG457_45075 [Streptomyces sp. NBC_01207]WTA23986.1 hypothetical protein OG365_38750 [Streptomyces sp. NBC_00853]